MDVTFDTPTRCAGPTGAGGEHIILSGTAGGQAFQFQTTLDEMRIEPEERRQAILMAARGLALDAGANTWLQFRTAVAGKTRKV